MSEVTLKKRKHRILEDRIKMPSFFRVTSDIQRHKLFWFWIEQYLKSSPPESVQGAEFEKNF